MGVRRPSLAVVARAKGASRITATISRISPMISSGVLAWALVLPPVDAYPSRTNAATRRTRPGRAERRTRLGGAGRPDRAATMGTLAIERAGRDAAKYAATTARTIARTITSHGRLNTPIRWWALVSRIGR